MAAVSVGKELNPEAPILGPRASRLGRGPDHSQLRQPIKTTVSGTRQVIHALETATGEVKKVLLDEINLMYECKICHSVFRSLANLISHKRTFCKAHYDDVQHMYLDKEGTDAVNMQTVVIEAEPVECVASAQASHDLQGYSPSFELLQTAGILDDLQGRLKPCVGPRTNRLVSPGRRGLGNVVQGLKARLDGAETDFMSKMQKNFEAPRPQSTMHLEPMFETRSAFQQSWRYGEDGETVGQTYRAWQQAEEENRRIRVGPGGEVMTNEATMKLVTGPDGQTYSVRVPLDDDVHTSVCPTEEGEGNVKYPCPNCKRTFLTPKKVIAHLVKAHDETLADAKKLKGNIRGSGTVEERKPKPVRVNDINCRPVKPVQVKVLNLTMTLNGRMNLCEQLSTDQSAVCPIMKTKITDSTKMEARDQELAEKVNSFVQQRDINEVKEFMIPPEVEAKISEYVNRRRVQCSTCQKRFTRSLLLKNHVAAQHLKLIRWECTLCDHGTWTKQSCMEHVATQHRLTDCASSVKELPMSKYFKEYLPEPEIIELDTPEIVDAIDEVTVTNGENDGEEPTELIVEKEEPSRCIVGVIINENHGSGSSNGLPTPGSHSEAESDVEEPVPKEEEQEGKQGKEKEQSKMGKQVQPSGVRGRGSGRRKSRGSRRSSISSGGRPSKRARSRSQASSEDREVTLNIQAPSIKMIKTSDPEPLNDEDTVPDNPSSRLNDEGDPAWSLQGAGPPAPQVPKLLIKFAGPNSTSPTVNEVGPTVGLRQQPPPEIIKDLTSNTKVPARCGETPPLRGRSKSSEDRLPPCSPTENPSRESSVSRSSSSSARSSPRSSSDLDSPHKPPRGDKF